MVNVEHQKQYLSKGKAPRGRFVVCALGVLVARGLDRIVQQFGSAGAGDGDLALAEVFGGRGVAGHVDFG